MAGFKMNESTLRSVFLGLILIYVIITFVGEIANPLALSIANVSASSLQGASIFGIMGIVIIGGLVYLFVTSIIGSGKGRK